MATPAIARKIITSANCKQSKIIYKKDLVHSLLYKSISCVLIKMTVNNEDEAIDAELTPDALDAAPGEVVGELLQHLEDYVPTVPDALAEKYLHRAGFDAVDPRIVRIIAVTAQKFISDIANDALQHCKTRSNSQHSAGHGSNKDKKAIKDRKYTLAIEDLTPALADHGITMRKPQYFV